MRAAAPATAQCSSSGAQRAPIAAARPHSSHCSASSRQLPSAPRAPTSSGGRLRCAAPRPRAAADGGTAAAAPAQQQPAAVAGAKPLITVHFRSEGVTTEAASGDVIMEVAERCGVTIPGGCYSGNCGICEVEVHKIKDAAAAAAAAPSAGAVVRACVARLPPGYGRIEIELLQDDQIWGLDGFDT